MSRTGNHRHVRTIVAALDRAEESDRAHPAGALTCVAGSIVEFGSSCERFALDRWTPQAMRSVVMAFALNCPERELRKMAEDAERQIRWCEWWDREGHAESGAA